MTQPAGQVWAHVGQAFTETSFDLVVIGAGRMGAALSLFLRRLAPERRLLLVEEGGLPNEDGATLLAPGVWSAVDVPPGLEARAEWDRALLASGDLGDVQFGERPLLRLAPGGEPLPPEVSPEWADPERLGVGARDDRAALFRPGGLALNAAQRAVGAGANLMLNTRVRLRAPGEILLDRLTVTNTHQIVVHETCRVQAGSTVIAAGARGPDLAEHGLGLHTPHARAYRQSVRLNLKTGGETPIVRVGSLTLRPQQEGFTLVPGIAHRDPHGYVPTGGHLTGVPTGLRRELLEALVEHMEDLPALASDALELGRSISDVAGAWVALPGGDPAAPPRWEALAPGLWLLLGGPKADALGLSTAYDLAATLAGQTERPWDA